MAHTAEVRTVEKQLVEVDRQSTDLKMQLIEAELEKVSFQQEHDVTVSELKEKLDQHYVLLCEERQHCGTTVQQLQFVIEEVCCIHTYNIYTPTYLRTLNIYTHELIYIHTYIFIHTYYRTVLVYLSGKGSLTGHDLHDALIIASLLSIQYNLI